MRPILIHIGPMPIYSYGVMLMLAFATGIAWSVREGRRRGISPDDILDFALYCLIFSIMGARFLYVILDLPGYLPHPLQAFMIWKGGLAYHGGLVAGLITAVLFTRARKIDFTLFAEVVTPAIPLAYAVARIGCFLNGCCYGKPCTLPWAVRFPNEYVPGTLTPPSHPTQIYSLLASLIVFGIIIYAQRWVKFNGQSFLLYVILYGAERFVIEFFRAPFPGRMEPEGLSLAQWASVASAAVAALIWYLVARSVAAKAAPEADRVPSSTGGRKP